MPTLVMDMFREENLEEEYIVHQMNECIISEQVSRENTSMESEYDLEQEETDETKQLTNYYEELRMSL